MTKKDDKIPVHQWTNNDGEVLILRFSDKDGTSYGGGSASEGIELPDYAEIF